MLYLVYNSSYRNAYYKELFNVSKPLKKFEEYYFTLTLIDYIITYIYSSLIIVSTNVRYVKKSLNFCSAKQDLNTVFNFQVYQNLALLGLQFIFPNC